MNRIFLLALLLSFNQARAEVKPYMDQMLEQIFTLKPYIVSDVEYRDPKNSQKINDALKKMVSLSEKISHEGVIKTGGFAVSSQALQQQLREAELVYRVGNKDYSLWMLRSTLSVCMSCHTQLPSGSTKFDFGKKDHFLAKPFDEAEFLFIVRNFEKAIPLYDQVLGGFPKNNVNADNLEKSLARKTYYFVRVKRDIPGLIASLNQNLKNKELPGYFSKKINALKMAAEKIKSQAYPEFNEMQKEELRQFAENNLKNELKGHFEMSPEKDLSYLKTSSVLYDYLAKNPESSMKPEILYWLSFCERRYEQKAFYSLPELYLKQCVLEHSNSAVAPACLQEYQDLVTMAYTGSSGVHVPKEVEKELKSMKEMVQKMQNSKKK